MTWTKIDDGFHTNPKILGLTDPAFRLYVTGLNWSVAQLTDGHITEVALPLCLPTMRQKPKLERVVAELVAAALWDRCDVHDSPRCWLVHDFTDYQPTRERVETDRERTRERQRRHRDKRKTDASRNALQTGTVTVPRPDPTRSTTYSLSSESDQLLATAVLAAFADAQGLAATPTWYKRYERAAAELLARVPDELHEYALPEQFVPWAVDNGCKIPNGLPEFVGSWLAERNGAPAQLDDCDICDNRRLVAMADEPDPTATFGFPVLEVDDPAAIEWPIVQCPACIPAREVAK